MNYKQFLISLIAFLIASNAYAAALPDDCAQLIVALAPDWNAAHGRLYLLHKIGGKWRAHAGPVPVLFGKNGLAWGSGIVGQDEVGLRKHERDGRAPAGIFRIGEVFTYDAALPPGADYPFHQVTEADVWSDDPRSPNYNRHILIDPGNPPDNYSHEKMRGGDFAYHWLIEIRHNSDPPVPGDGSAIFFHIRRGVNRPTTGCTTMAKPDLVRLVSWLRAPKHPCYALLTEADYAAKWQSWNLPEPNLVGLEGRASARPGRAEARPAGNFPARCLITTISPETASRIRENPEQNPPAFFPPICLRDRSGKIRLR